MTYRFYEHTDSLHGDADLPSSPSMLDFWRWAFSDLLEDTLKGLYAEWLVGQLLGLPMRHGGRPGYGNFDLRSPAGLRIEVKSSAYWQSWKLRDQDGVLKPAPEIDRWRPSPSHRICFGGLRARDVVTRDGAVGYKADVYVFCLQKEIDPARWDALDLSQWEFYVLSRAELEATGLSSLTLKRLRQLCPAMTARDFQRCGRERLAVLEALIIEAPAT